ncbi:MAG: 4-oxalocrotonate tautomerase [Solirubrobacterales bacterium]|jgi:4-oxalocrotonate tautomerase|nr:4-oxalocrotonate tautomerase [Solirubrobacterales bacterium]
MPVVNLRAMENVLSLEQKNEIAEQFTDTLASVIGEPVRELTWVIVDDIASGALTIAGQSITTEAVKEMLAGAPAGA